MFHVHTIMFLLIFSYLRIVIFIGILHAVEFQYFFYLFIYLFTPHTIHIAHCAHCLYVKRDSFYIIIIIIVTIILFIRTLTALELLFIHLFSLYLSLFLFTMIVQHTLHIFANFSQQNSNMYVHQITAARIPTHTNSTKTITIINKGITTITLITIIIK